MQTLDSFPSLSKTARGGRYNYSALFDGRVWKLVRDKDFNTRPTNVVTCIRAAAKARGIKVRCVSDGNSVYVQREDSAQ